MPMMGQVQRSAPGHAIDNSGSLEDDFEHEVCTEPVFDRDCAYTRGSDAMRARLADCDVLPVG